MFAQANTRPGGMDSSRWERLVSWGSGDRTETIVRWGDDNYFDANLIDQNRQNHPTCGFRGLELGAQEVSSQSTTLATFSVSFRVTKTTSQARSPTASARRSHADAVFASLAQLMDRTSLDRSKAKAFDLKDPFHPQKWKPRLKSKSAALRRCKDILVGGS